ncbi:MAG TPA: PsbP-related protein [Patescibacteria group bacterium]|nr:PsbP-related protein [Patescibacteria group bacterium]
MKPWLKVLITIIITGGIVGSVTYYLVQKKATTDKNSLQSQIDDLNKKLAATNAAITAATSTTSTTSSTTATTDPTAEWKTYTNTTYRFSFKYPSTYYYASPDGFPDTIFFSTATISFPKESEGPIVPIFVSVTAGTSLQDEITKGKSDYNLSGYSQTTIKAGNESLTKISGTAGSNSMIEGKQLIEVFTLKNSKLIKFTFISGVNVESTTFDQIISTLEFN